MADTEHPEQGDRQLVVQRIVVSGKSRVRDIVGYVGGDWVRGHKVAITIGGSATLAAVILLVVMLVALHGGVPVILLPLPTVIPPSPTSLAFAPAHDGEALIILVPYTGRLKEAEVFPERFVRDTLRARVQKLNLRGYSVRLEQWTGPVSTAREAREIGQAYQATLVVWGEFDDVGGIRTFIEVLRDVPVPETKQAGEWLPFSSFPQQQQSIGTVTRECLMVGSPRQAEYLVLISLGIVALTESDYLNADQLFTDAIIAVFVPSACHTDARGAYYWRGMTRSLQERYADAVADFDHGVTLDARSRAAYGQRGMARFILGDTAGASADMQAALELTDINDRQGQAIALGNLGLVYEFQGELEKARDYYQRSLALDLQTGNSHGQATDLGWLGNLSLRQGNLDAAMNHYQNALALYEATGEIRGKAAMLGNIGLVHELRGQFDVAQDLYEKALESNRGIGYRQGEAIDLGHLGSLHQRRHMLDRALDYHQQALDTCQTISFQLCQAVALGNIGLILYERGDVQSAVAYYQQALAIDQKIGYRYGEAKQLINTGLVQQNQGNLSAAQESYAQALALYQQIGSRDGEAQAYVGLGMVAAKQGNRQTALASFRRALALFESLGLPDAQAVRDALQKLEP